MSFSFGNQLPTLCISISSSRKNHKLLILFIIIILCISNLLCVFELLFFLRLSSLSDSTLLENNHIITSNTFPPCEKGQSEHIRPRDVSKIQYKRVLQAEHVVAYIVREMDKMGAPVTIMFGSVLHEYRNGTGDCVEYNMRDKDFDVVVLPEDFPKLFRLIDNIEAQFGWHVITRIDERLYLMFGPGGMKHPGYGFQIDLYSFHRDQPEKGLLYFPWDKVSFEMDLFFPLVKYKSIASMIGVNETENKSSNSARASDSMESHVVTPVHYYMPANVPCLLAKMYGDDFMTPKLGPGNKGYGTKDNVFRQSDWCRGEIDAEK